MNEGFYWIIYKEKVTVGHYVPKTDIGTDRPFPWTIMGERVGFETWELTVIEHIKEPTGHV